MRGQNRDVLPWVLMVVVVIGILLGVLAYTYLLPSLLRLVPPLPQAPTASMAITLPAKSQDRLFPPPKVAIVTRFLEI